VPQRKPAPRIRKRRVVRAASPKRRLLGILIAMTIAFVVIGARLVNLQALDTGRYAQLGLDQRVHTVNLAAERGAIFDRHGADLAISAPRDTLWADPRVISDPSGYAATLAPMLNIDQKALAQRLSQRGLAFVYVARKVDPEVVKQVMALRLPGIDTTRESKRFYPSGSVAASLLGSVGTDNQGLFGLEAGYESVLAGRPGQMVIEQDPRGREIPSSKRSFNPAQAGRDLVLTLDQSLQYETEQILLNEIAVAQAKNATAVIVDVQTGDVLTMATVNGATATQPAQVARDTDRNRPLTDVFEPGSTNKVITMAGALEDGVVKPDQRFTIPSSIHLGGKPFTDDEPHGTVQMSLTEIMSRSSNLGTIKVAGQLGPERFDHYLRAFGLGKKTSVKFPGQESGLLLPLSSYNATSMGSMPIGQGVAVTSLQMLDAYLTIANGGVSVNPRLVAATVDAHGERHDAPIARGTRVVSEQTAKVVTQMLQSVVTQGTGTAAAIPGYAVAGKTGTARKPPYDLNQHVASFVGFAPANAPRLAIAVVIDEPKTKIYGGEVAAPAFAGIMQNALRVIGVPPDTPVAGPPPAFQGQANWAARSVTTTTVAPAASAAAAAAGAPNPQVTATAPTTTVPPRPAGTPAPAGPPPGAAAATATGARAGPTGTLTGAASPSG
jgi:cell division protein FtsI (penicillin-binding protein 3)